MPEQLTLMSNAFEERYSSRYEELNPEQKKAVDLIEGPVLVLAGPGTGKTELLAMRIANILRQTQLSASNILCLTFTEAAVTEMRSRLSEIIGPDANRVAVFTFHAFCQNVISEHSERFAQLGSDAELISELEQVSMLRGIIDTLPHGDPYKPVSNPYLHVKNFLSTVSDLKREQITPDVLVAGIEMESKFSALHGESLQTFIGTHASSLKTSAL